MDSSKTKPVCTYKRWTRGWQISERRAGGRWKLSWPADNPHQGPPAAVHPPTPRQDPAQAAVHPPTPRQDLQSTHPHPPFPPRVERR